MRRFTMNSAVGLLLIITLCVAISGCGSPEEQLPDPSTIQDVLGGKDDAPEVDPDVTGSRDNTIQVLVPTASGVSVYSCDVATLDASNSSEGYVIVNYTGNNPKVKLQITGPNQVTYTYNLHGGEEVFPLTSESGTYTIAVYESVDIENNKYATAFSQDINADITNPFGPYLYPSQYVNFSASSQVVIKASELAKPANNDLDVVTNVYNYVITNYTYDYEKASTVASGYLPDVDEIYELKTGICFDYAAIMASMLRSQRIPTRLEIGYAGEEYHAWISVYTPETGWINGIIEFDGTNWRLMDPTFAASSSSPMKFIAEDSDYLLKYVY